MSKLRRPHATRNRLGLPFRGRGGFKFDLGPDQVLGMLRLSGKSALTIGLATLMMIFISLLLVNFVGQVLQSARLEQQRTTLEVEVARIRAENLRLEGAVAFTESQVYAERVAREQLGYAREGDTVILPRTAPASAPPSDPALDAPAQLPLPPAPENWRVWWQAFFPDQS